MLVSFLQGPIAFHSLRGEAYEARTDTEAAALACRHTHAGGEDVQHGEDRCSRDRYRQDLIHRQALPGNKHQRQSYRHALHYVLDDAGQ